MINKLQIKGLHSPNHQHLPGSTIIYSSILFTFCFFLRKCELWQVVGSLHKQV